MTCENKVAWLACRLSSFNFLLDPMFFYIPVKLFSGRRCFSAHHLARPNQKLASLCSQLLQWFYIFADNGVNRIKRCRYYIASFQIAYFLLSSSVPTRCVEI